MDEEGINIQAPVAGRSEIEIAAPPDAVGEVLTAFERWPSWNPDVKSIAVEPAAGRARPRAEASPCIVES